MLIESELKKPIIYRIVAENGNENQYAGSDLFEMSQDPTLRSKKIIIAYGSLPYYIQQRLVFTALNYGMLNQYVVAIPVENLLPLLIDPAAQYLDPTMEKTVCALVTSNPEMRHQKMIRKELERFMPERGRKYFMLIHPFYKLRYDYMVFAYPQSFQDQMQIKRKEELSVFMGIQRVANVRIENIKTQKVLSLSVPFMNEVCRFNETKIHSPSEFVDFMNAYYTTEHITPSTEIVLYFAKKISS